MREAQVSLRTCVDLTLAAGYDRASRGTMYRANLKCPSPYANWICEASGGRENRVDIIYSKWYTWRGPRSQAQIHTLVAMTLYWFLIDVRVNHRPQWIGYLVTGWLYSFSTSTLANKMHRRGLHQSFFAMNDQGWNRFGFVLVVAAIAELLTAASSNTNELEKTKTLLIWFFFLARPTKQHIRGTLFVWTDLEILFSWNTASLQDDPPCHWLCEA